MEAADLIDQESIPVKFYNSLYWVELPDGREYPFKHITRRAFALTEENKGEYLEFESEPRYRKDIEKLGFKINYYKEGYNFFTHKEADYFSQIAGKSYRANNPQNVLQGEFLKLLVSKINKWAELVLIDDFVYKKDRHWKWTANLKSYLWIKIYRKGADKAIYFIVGMLHTGDLYIELNCQRSKSSIKPLPKIQIDIFDDYLLRDGCKRLTIKKDELESLCWDDLVKITQEYVNRYLALYDELERSLGNGSLLNAGDHPEDSILDLLTPGPVPENISSRIPKERVFKGRKIDWSKKQKTSSALGSSGEQLVINYEKEKLRRLDLEDRADEVRKVYDGDGYDILSFNEKEEEIYIEVKTTCNGCDEPFYMSLNEKEFCYQNPGNYYLYRLYNFDVIRGRAEFYCLTANELNGLKLAPISFEVSTS